MLRYLINFIYPPRCAACGDRMGADTVGSVCDACIERIERVPEPICQLCGLPLQAAIPPPFLETADGQRGNPALCRACVESPPHFRRARAVALYRPGIT